MKKFDVQEAKAYLADLKGQAPRKDTMREKIRELIPEISELVEQGYTKKQIFELLREKFDLQITYGTFRTYLAQKDREEDDDGNIELPGPG